MKKIAITLIVILTFSLPAFSKAPFTEFKVGMLNPSDAKSGYIFGLNLGQMIDESLSWSFEFNYFQKNYRKTTTVATGQIANGTYTTQQLEVEMTSRIIPLFAKLNYEHPLGYRSPFYVRASAGLGWEFAWNKENNYEKNEFKNRFFHGFGWQASGGIGFEISSSANLFADLFYNGATVKRNQKTSELGYPTWEEMDLSGLGIRIGVSIVGFGW